MIIITIVIITIITIITNSIDCFFHIESPEPIDIDIKVKQGVH